MVDFDMRRRDFLASGFVLASRLQAPRPSLVTLSDWLSASPDERQRAMPGLLAHIKAADAPVQAWVEVSPQASTSRGPLAWIPYAVKDVIETKGMATEYGSPVYKGRKGTTDAAVVSLLRDRGAVLLGKLHTAAFAFRTPPPTRNPRNLDHTPGGSSSGSAAAVAADMVPLAVGTQTGGSTLRPASYCGVTGFKPTYGVIPTTGVLPLAASLDTLGFFTHRATDMLAFWSAFGQPTRSDPSMPVLAFVDPLPEAVEAPMANAFRQAVNRLRERGVRLQPVDLAAMLVKLHDAQQTVQYYEGARFHEERFRTYGDRLLDLADLVRKGLAISESTYGDAMRFIVQSRMRVADIYSTTPIILSPAATGPAPKGGSYTGNSSMNTPWTPLHTPAIALPMPVGAALPLGLQLTARPGGDALLLRTAVEVERLLGSGSVLQN